MACRSNFPLVSEENDPDLKSGRVTSCREYVTDPVFLCAFVWFCPSFHNFCN